MPVPERLVIVLESEVDSHDAPQSDTTGRQSSTSLSSISNVIESHNVKLEPVFGPNVKSRQQQALENALPVPDEGGPAISEEQRQRMRSLHPLAKTPDLSTFYYVEGAHEKLEALRDELSANENIQHVYIQPPPVLQYEEEPKAANGVVPDKTPGFTGRQLYLNEAPGGMDIRYAWLFPGGRGAGITVVDVESGWVFTHECLCNQAHKVIVGNNSTDPADSNHGTAALGVVGASNAGFGIMGIASDAETNVCGQERISSDIDYATNALKAGDIILIEWGVGGPENKYVPCEWHPDVFGAIVAAVAKGIVVVEPASNGGADLDAAVYNTATWDNPFDMSGPISGAVLVGGGFPPASTHSDHPGWVDRAKCGKTDWGWRVDVQGWHSEVTTLGYGTLQDGPDQNRWYTDCWTGTSSASATIAGALASLQGILRARGRRPFTSLEARSTLRCIGSPQQDAPNLPRSMRIGKRPNMRKLIPLAAGFKSRIADYDGDGFDEILAVTSKGIALLKVNNNKLTLVKAHHNNEWLVEWSLWTGERDVIGPVGDFDGDGAAETLIKSKWGLGILKFQGNGFKSIAMIRNGTWMGEWLLQVGHDNIIAVADFDGDGVDEILVTSPWGMGILKKQGPTLKTVMVAKNGTLFGDWVLDSADNDFSLVGCFDGGRRACIFATSPSGIGLFRLDGSTLALLGQLPNGSHADGSTWYLDTAQTRFGPVGNFDGDEREEIFFVNRTWGVGVIKFTRTGHFIYPMLCPDGDPTSGWELKADSDAIPTACDFDGDGRDEILVKSRAGLYIVKPVTVVEDRLNTRIIAQDHFNCQPSGWLIQTKEENDWPGSGGRFTRKDRASILVESRWGLGILDVDNKQLGCHVMNKNGSQIGNWTLDTSSTDFGHGF